MMSFSKRNALSILFLVFTSINGYAQWVDMGKNSKFKLQYLVESINIRLSGDEFERTGKLKVRITNISGQPLIYHGNDKMAFVKIPYKKYLGLKDEEIYICAKGKKDEIFTLAENASYTYDFGRIKCVYPSSYSRTTNDLAVKSWGTYKTDAEKKDELKEKRRKINTPMKIFESYGILQITNKTMGGKLQVYINNELVDELKFRKSVIKKYPENTKVTIKVIHTKNNKSDERSFEIRTGYKYLFSVNTDFENSEYLDRMLELWNGDEAIKIFK